MAIPKKSRNLAAGVGKTSKKAPMVDPKGAYTKVQERTLGNMKKGGKLKKAPIGALIPLAVKALPMIGKALGVKGGAGKGLLSKLGGMDEGMKRQILNSAINSGGSASGRPAPRRREDEYPGQMYAMKKGGRVSKSSVKKISKKK